MLSIYFVFMHVRYVYNIAYSHPHSSLYLMHIHSTMLFTDIFIYNTIYTSYTYTLSYTSIPY